MIESGCPRCGGDVHRSHTRGAKERILKFFTGIKAYRCSGCGWRGLKASPRHTQTSGFLRIGLTLLITLLVTILITLYITGNIA